MADTSYYWKNKDERAVIAKHHTKRMDDFYLDKTVQSALSTKLYDDNTPIGDGNLVEHITVRLEPMGSVDAIFEHAQGKTAVLNFASYKNPGGGFLSGSRAQEECLCHESNLFNILVKQQNYYDWNNLHKNRSLYLNRALYTPNVIFSRAEVEPMLCDVITCAAPNITPNRKYGGNITEEENSQVLESRIKFVLDIAKDNKVQTLILGAFGCGVFGQDAEQVCALFLKHLQNYHCFSKVVFAVPQDVHSENYNKFKKVLDNWKN